MFFRIICYSKKLLYFQVRIYFFNVEMLVINAILIIKNTYDIPTLGTMDVEKYV